MTPRILIDATAIPGNRGGVGRYLDGLLSGLATVDAPVAVVAHPRDFNAFAALGLEVIAAPAWIGHAPLRLIWEQLALPRLMRRGGFDVLHSPHYTFPVRGRFGRVVTIHDLTFFTLPEAHSPLKRRFFRSWLVRLARVPYPVIAVSRTTADEFVRLLGAERSRITVALHGFDAATFRVPKSEDISAFGAGLNPPVSRWISFLGTFEPRKNVVALIEAHTKLGAQAPPLLLAGGPGWDPAVAPAIEAARARGVDVRVLGYLPVERLSAFLGGSELVAYPSLGEGFGLPVLEAMATGACVLTTRELALPEVGGDAVAYTATGSDEICAAITALLADPVRRSALRSAALRRASEFTWTKAAHAHLDAYRRAT
jgi:glycosyltransferase involved in cell wall biosynthesis